ncbi:hypothetical protein HDU96_004904 [Phlyctochytrium bullatum]|nr:hypothetical protein HDU96_004904 [Phlyctochytrium bullatum]
MASLETLPVDIAHQITLHLDLCSLETLLRTSTAVARLFGCTELSFALTHIRRLLPPPSPKPEHECNPYCSCTYSHGHALYGPDYAVLPQSYAVAAFSLLGFRTTTFAFVFGDTDTFHIENGVGPIGPKKDPRWIEGILLALMRQRMVDAIGVELMIQYAAMLDSSDLAAAIIEWQRCNPRAAAAPANSIEGNLKVLVAQVAARAVQKGALGVLAFALDHECEIDPWDLPNSHMPPESWNPTSGLLPLDKTLLMHVEEETATRFLLGFPLPSAPLKRAHALAMPAGGTERRLNSGLTAIQRVAQLGHVGIFDLLIDAGAAYVNVGGFGPYSLEPLVLAAIEGHHTVVSRLLRLEGADVNHTPGILGMAVEKGSLELLTELMEFGAAMYEGDLRTALCRNNLGALELMLRNGGEPDRSDSAWYDRTLLASCCPQWPGSSGNPKACRLLLAHGADVNERLRNGDTALHIAFDGEVARLFIEHGADVEARDGAGKTPLHRLCEHGSAWSHWCVEIARVLLEAGADVNAVTTTGQTCLGLLPEPPNGALRDLLLSYGARHRGEEERT